MSPLVPCPGCQRHVRSDEKACPFCGASLEGLRVEPATAPGRKSRAWLFVAGASVLAAGVGLLKVTTRAVYGGPPPDLDAAIRPLPPPPDPDHAMKPVYGGPPVPVDWSPDKQPKEVVPPEPPPYQPPPLHKKKAKPKRH